jgi:hypothetical protein
VGAELFHVDILMDRWMDGWTDMTKPVVAFCGFANAPKRKENPVLGTN